MSAKFSFTESDIAAQRLIDNEYKEQKWQELESALSQKYGESSSREIVEAFRELYSLYSSDVMRWCAGLFDPVIGGYYYSNSGRDFDNVDYNGKNYKLRPDLESTYQADGFSGIFPAGEGAGYAGGIVSSAVDGIKCAEALLRKYSFD